MRPVTSCITWFVIASETAYNDTSSGGTVGSDPQILLGWIVTLYMLMKARSAAYDA
jgi:hypothetical protein